MHPERKWRRPLLFAIGALTIPLFIGLILQNRQAQKPAPSHWPAGVPYQPDSDTTKDFLAYSAPAGTPVLDVLQQNKLGPSSFDGDGAIAFFRQGKTTLCFEDPEALALFAVYGDGAGPGSHIDLTGDFSLVVGPAEDILITCGAIEKEVGNFLVYWVSTHFGEDTIEDDQQNRIGVMPTILFDISLNGKNIFNASHPGLTDPVKDIAPRNSIVAFFSALLRYYLKTP